MSTTMRDFPSRHNAAPQTERFPMSNGNEAFARLESSKAPLPHRAGCGFWIRLTVEFVPVTSRFRSKQL